MPKIAIPDDLMCPITHQIFKEPVIATDGHTYEQSAIKKWLTGNKVSPLTREKMGDGLIINLDKKKQVIDFFEKNKITTFDKLLDAIRDKNLTALQSLNYTEELLTESYSVKGTLLHAATVCNSPEIVAYLLDEGANPQATDAEGKTPLHHAHSKEIAQLLLEHHSQINAKSKKGSTPLHIAAARGNSKLVEFLIDKGADIEAKDNDGFIPANMRDLVSEYTYECKSQEYEKISYLLTKASKTEIERYGTPLHLAIAHNEIEEVKNLLFSIDIIGEDFNVNTKNKTGSTPLHEAARRGNKKIMKLLLREKAGVDSQDNDGNTPLHLAAKSDHLAAIRLLLDKGANVTIKNAKGQTPLELATNLDRKKAVNTLLMYEAPKKINQLIEVIEKQNQTIAALEKKLATLTQQLQQLAEVQQETHSSSNPKLSY